jgi:hypothetical protein
MGHLALPSAAVERRAEPAVSEAEGQPAPRLAECRSQPEILKITYTPATGALNGVDDDGGSEVENPLPARPPMHLTDQQAF